MRSWSTGVIAAACVSGWLYVNAAAPPAPPAPPGSYMVAVATDGKGAFFVADASQKAVFRVAEGKKEIVAKGEGKPRTPLYGLRSLAVAPDGSLVAADPASSEVYRIGRDGKAAPLGGGRLGQPLGVAVSAKGEIFVADLTGDALYRIADGAVQKLADVASPASVALDKDGSFLVLSRSRSTLLRVTADGKAAPVIKDRKLQFPQCVLVEEAGTYLVSDSYAKAVFRVTRDGQVTAVAAGGSFQSPQGLALEPGGSVLVADPHARSIFRIAPDGKVSVAYKE